jgi:mono/diheme cytochrome c family protein/small nuclear ribonucleoprotein (snRNP)-like protein
MHHSRQLRILAALLWVFLTTQAYLGAQEGTSSSGRSQRGGRGNIREFLGLGPAPDPLAAERGQKLYAANCAFCHGEKARGAEAPSLVRSPLVLHDEKGELIAPVLIKGRVDKGMPAFPSLSEAQTYDIAQFLHLQIELAANRGTYKRLNVVTGDARKGESYFNGAGRCNTCHSVTGDLAHIAGKYPPDLLQTKFLWPDAGGGFEESARIRKVTVRLPSGESIAGTLKSLDDFNVALYDAAGNYRSWSRDNVKVEVEDRLATHRQLLDNYTDADIHNLLAYLVTLK